LAEKLHIEFPDKYKDPNHKPEIAVALCDNFIACYGFASSQIIQQNLQQNPVLQEIFEVAADFVPNEQFLQDIVKRMFYDLDTEDNKDLRTSYIQKIIENI
tara:strand:- start:722 stop:1024 length:303 start_codon:yes stop_codon:yes gene_type:complete